MSEVQQMILAGDLNAVSSFLFLAKNHALINESLNSKGYTPLILAIAERQMAIANHLLSKLEVDLNKSDNRGKTPLMHAVMIGDKKSL